jgi:hypothetical protein
MHAKLAPHHHRPGRTKHRLVGPDGPRDFPPFIALTIAQFQGDNGFYLLYTPESGMGTDTWHQSLEDAFHQAEHEFGVIRIEWIQTEQGKVQI